MRKGIIVMGLVMVVGLLLSSSNVLAQVCVADTNCDGRVGLADLVIVKGEFLRVDCNPVCNTPVFGGVPRTGQTTSYATGDDGDLEKGVASPTERFTDKGDGTVKDNLTGLIWLKDANCFSESTWHNALSDCNALSTGSCGLTDGSSEGDWRLPNVNELISLVDRGRYLPALSSGHPFSNVQSYYYWSATTNIPSPTLYAWVVSMSSGEVASRNKPFTYYVWPVRGPE